MLDKSELDKAIRKVKDFPKPGILFYDITGIFHVPKVFKDIVDEMESLYRDKGIDLLLAVESRGFVFASPLAERLGIPFALARKKGKLPGETVEVTYDLEYGSATLEVQKVDIEPGKNVLIIDDLIATGGTLKACSELVEKCGSEVYGFFGVIGLPFLPYKDLLKGYKVTTLIDYMSE